MITLVCCTLGRRPAELSRLLATVNAADVPVQVILVVQGSTRPATLFAQLGARVDAISEVIETERGLSRGRNAALPSVMGEVVGFPDDDCWYDHGTLKRVLAVLSHKEGPDVLCGSLIDESGLATGPRGRSRNRSRLELRHVPLVANSNAMFWRTGALLRLGAFEETLGLGASTDWVAGEDIEILARACHIGLRVQYSRELTVRHPAPEEGSISEVGYRSYGRGYGRALALGKFGPVTIAAALLRPMLGMITRNASARRRRSSVLVGRLEGLLGRTIGSSPCRWR